MVDRGTLGNTNAELLESRVGMGDDVASVPSAVSGWIRAAYAG
jgi:hypothetical protein